MTIVSADFAFRQDRYTGGRRFIRDFLLRTLAFNLLARVETEGLDNIPPHGPTVLIYNHVHAIDPVAVAGAVRPRFVVPMSKVENFHLPVFGQLIRWWGAYPVHRGQLDRVAIQNTIDLLRGGHLVLISPEGTRQPALIRGKDGTAYVATRTGAVVVPVAVEGTYRFEHNLKRLRRTPISLRFGRPFAFRRRGSIPRGELARMTDEAMYQLAMLLPEHRRGYYRDLAQATTETITFLMG